MHGLRRTDATPGVTEGLADLNLRHRTASSVRGAWRSDDAPSGPTEGPRRRDGRESAPGPTAGPRRLDGRERAPDPTEPVQRAAGATVALAQRAADDDGDLHESAADDSAQAGRKTQRSAWAGVSGRARPKPGTKASTRPGTKASTRPGANPGPQRGAASTKGAGLRRGGSTASTTRGPSRAQAGGRKPLKSGIFAQAKRGGVLGAGPDKSLVGTMKGLMKGPKIPGMASTGVSGVAKFTVRAAHAARAVVETARRVIAAVLASSKVLIIAALVIVIVLALVMAVLAIVPGIGHEAEKEEQAICAEGIPAANADVANLPLSVAGYGPAELTNAAIIMQVANDSGLDRRAQMIGIMTAIQESNLGKDPTAAVPDENGDAGLFQQRQKPTWYGTLEQVNDPAYAASAFFNGVTATEPGGYGSAGGGTGNGHIPGLKDIPNWQSLPLTEAAANVQRPAEKYRGEYAKHESTANEIINALGGTTVTLGEGGAVSGCAASGGVTGAATGSTQAVLDQAMSWEGKGLVYNLGSGTLDGPTGGAFDCSSFVGSAWKSGAGIEFGRSAREQWANLAPYRVSVDELQPGDLIFEAWGSRLDSGVVSHVAMYIGNGQMVEWSRTKNGFAVGPARTSGYQYVGAARPPAPDAAATEATP